MRKTKRNPYFQVLLLTFLIILVEIGVFILMYSKGISNDKVLIAIPLTISISGALGSAGAAVLKFHAHVSQVERERESAQEERQRAMEQMQREIERTTYERQQTEDRIKWDRERELRDRRSNAIARLRADDLVERCDAICDLEKIALITSDDHDRATIQHELSMFVCRGIENTSRRAEPNRPERDVFRAAEALSFLYTHYQLPADLHKLWAKGVNLRLFHFKGANFGWANFEDAILHAANLENANLECANFEGASLMDAHFEGTDLKGAYLDGVKGLSVDQLLLAKNVESAHLASKLRSQYNRIKSEQK